MGLGAAGLVSTSETNGATTDTVSSTTTELEGEIIPPPTFAALPSPPEEVEEIPVLEPPLLAPHETAEPPGLVPPDTPCPDPRWRADAPLPPPPRFDVWGIFEDEDDLLPGPDAAAVETPASPEFHIDAFATPAPPTFHIADQDDDDLVERIDLEPAVPPAEFDPLGIGAAITEANSAAAANGRNRDRSRSSERASAKSRTSSKGTDDDPGKIFSARVGKRTLKEQGRSSTPRAAKRTSSSSEPPGAAAAKPPTVPGHAPGSLGHHLSGQATGGASAQPLNSHSPKPLIDRSSPAGPALVVGTAVEELRSIIASKTAENELMNTDLKSKEHKIMELTAIKSDNENTIEQLKAAGRELEKRAKTMAETRNSNSKSFKMSPPASWSSSLRNWPLANRRSRC